ncbi:MAG: hypothetical protein K8F92_01725 [Hyphomicrobium sp.]|uniref:hypothetical protein n=1 Tax=Hyphomicrobium sp. TaxID=82 RepID=UPI001325F856|nr:hypothetical protein [Hyphomicrobium sp.]KAB2942223.1 MAG: hypothetical protein F9K20_06695 [Hyphomicrobium sp.]MBZ0208360.1 hypothetical protein [Hyphomicrobium sp.]MCZ7595642.1 hypothetical protein [Hyphomicrobium sp.]
MVQTSVQFTPVQVLQAARRAEAEGKMDYALQFYRHLVEQHGTTVEAQEAREGLFRIAEWRWGEARVARSREAGAASPQSAQAAPPPNPSVGGQRVYNVANHAPPSGYAADQQQAPTGMPQIVSRQQGQGEEDLPPLQPRFRVAKFVAHALSGIGWLMLLSGIALAVGAGSVGQLAAVALFGLPLGVLVGAPAVVLGLALVVAGQLAAAVFESTNATLELVAIERGRTSF